MSSTAVVYLEDPATALLTYTTIRLWRDTDPGGAFTTLVTTTPIVAGTFEYVIEDSGGSATSYYRFSLYHATGPVESDQSAPFHAGLSLAHLRVEGAIRAGAGFKGAATGGTLTSLVDAVLPDSGVDPNFLAGGWLYRPNAAEDSDRVRRTPEAAFTVSTGSLGPLRTYTNPPAAAEEYHYFNLFPPVRQAGALFSWDDVVRIALGLVSFIDLLELGTGTATGKTLFSLDTFAGQIAAHDVRRVFLRTEDDDGNFTYIDASKQGSDWHLVENGPEDLNVQLLYAPGTDQSVVAEVLRTDAALYRDDDVTTAPRERVLRAIAYECWRVMNMRQPGKYTGEMAAAAAHFEAGEATAEPYSLVSA